MDKKTAIKYLKELIRVEKELIAGFCEDDEDRQTCVDYQMALIYAVGVLKKG